MYDRNNLILETDGSGLTQLYYTVSVSEYGEYVSQRHGTAGSTDYYTYDTLGSTDRLLDGSANEENRYIYSAFGHIQAQQSTVVNHHTWVGTCQ